MTRAGLLLALLLLGMSAQAQPAAPDRPAVLRVCADPDNLPLSHRDGSGFENRIAQLVAEDFGVPLEYAWLPDRRGFVRKTLGENRCDVIIGVPTGFERTATTRPYYRSRYVMVDRAGAQAAPTDWDDPRFKRWRIGVQLIGDDLAASPPGHALARHGAIANVVGIPLAGDEPSALRLTRAVARGELDAALVWGPQAGWFAQHAEVPLRITPLQAPADLAVVPFAYSMAMGVRRGDAALRAALDDFITRRQPDIDRILAQYAVPVEARP